VAKDIAKDLEALLAPLAAGHGLELWAAEVAGSGQHPLVRVLLDRVGGVTLDDITEANAWIGEALDDGEGVLTGAYTLEVSSPGVDRPLRTPDHFKRFLGETAEVTTVAPVEGRKSFTGTIAAADDDGLVLGVEGTPIRLSYGEVAKARLKVALDFGNERS
jgi:ribosome maturation factor RimP